MKSISMHFLLVIFLLLQPLASVNLIDFPNPTENLYVPGNLVGTPMPPDPVDTDLPDHLIQNNFHIDDPLIPGLPKSIITQDTITNLNDTTLIPEAINDSFYGWQRYGMTGLSWEDVDMLSETDGWAVGRVGNMGYLDVGNIGVTAHYDGVTWSLVENPRPYSLTSVSTVSSANVWAVGQYGTILNYDGVSWKLIQSPTVVSLTSIQMLDENTGWIGGASGTLLKFNGQEWTSVANPISGMSETFTKISMISPDDGWAISSNGFSISKIWQYHQGSWTIAYSFSGWLDSLDALSNTNIWTAGFPYDGTNFGSQVFVRFDGIKWNIQPCGMNGGIEDLDMISVNDGWAVTGGVAYHYNGIGWTGAAESLHVTDIDMISSTMGFGVGLGTFAQLADGKWVDRSDPTASSGSDIQMLSENEGWASTYDGEVLHYLDGKWAVTQKFDKSRFYDIDLLSETSGWAVGIDYTVYPSRSIFAKLDNGVWSSYQSPFQGIIIAIGMVSTDEGWAVGYYYIGSEAKGTIYHFTNGQWSLYSDSIRTGLKDLNMISQDEGWAVGMGGIILHYDQGAWQEVASPTTTDITSVDMISSSEGWATLAKDGLVKFDNGSWVFYSLPNSYLSDIDMLSSTEGWAVEGGGLHYYGIQPMWHFYSGNWTPEPLPTKFVTHKVDMVSPTKGWGVGDFGAIVKYDLLPSITISGNVQTSDGKNLQGVTITDGSGHSTVTDASGSYSFQDLLPGTYTITPQKSGYNFTTPNQQLSISSFDVPNIDFIGTASSAWTLIYYLDGDNNLSDTYQRIFNRLEAGSNPAANVVVLLDTLKKGDTAYYWVQNDSNLSSFAFYQEGITRWSKNELNMADPQTLTDFVIWARNTFPAQHYALIMDDHGGGLAGAMNDTTNNGSGVISVKAIRSALSTITGNGTNKIDVLVMNACLMGMIEDAYEFSPFIDYYVANENLQNTYYGGYTHQVNWASAYKSPSDYAKDFAFGYASDPDISPAYPYTISVADMSKLNGMISSLSQLASAINADMSGNATTFSIVLNKVQRFNNINGNDSGIDRDDTYVDLYDFARHASEEFQQQAIKDSSQALMDAISSYIIYNKHAAGIGVDNSYGVSIFIPNIRSSFYDGNSYSFASGTNWASASVSGQSLKLPSVGLGEIQELSSVGWGEMLVNYFDVTQPGGPDDPIPPAAVEKGRESNIFFPLLFCSDH